MTLNRTFARLPFAAAAALVTVTSFALTAPASAAPGAAPVMTAATALAAATDASTKICVVERLTGSRLDKKICRTKAQWEALGGLPAK